MSVGNAWVVGNTTALWKIVFKKNTPDGGVIDTFHVAEKSEADARAIAVDLAGRIKAMMPGDCNIFYAVMSRDNTDRDSRFIPEALGDGTYVLTGSPVVATKYDYKRTALLLRFENEVGGLFSHKICPIGDLLVEEGELLVPPADVVGIPADLPAAPVEAEDFNVTLNAFMQAVVKQCHHVVAGHPPGGAYTYFNIVNSYFIRVASKKGGRVFIG